MRDGDGDRLVVLVGGRGTSGLRLDLIAGADEIAVPVPVVVAAERVVHHHDALAALGEGLQVGAARRAQRRRHVVQHQHVVPGSQVAAIRRLARRLVIPDEPGLLEQRVERRGIVVPARDDEQPQRRGARLAARDGRTRQRDGAEKADEQRRAAHDGSIPTAGGVLALPVGRVYSRRMFTATANLLLPSTTTGSFPRPRWFDVSMWGRPLDTCMLDVRFREKFQDALAVVIADQERAGLDVLTHGDFHCDEDMGGRAWHHYPLQRWAGFEGDHLQPEATTAPWLHYPPGTLLNEIYTGWRWPHVVDKIEHRPLDYAKLWRIAQSKTRKPIKFGTCCSQVMALFLDIHTPKYKDKRQVIWDMAEAMNKELLRAARRRLPVHPDRGADVPLHGQHVRQGP